MRDGPWKMLAKLEHGRLPKYENVHTGNRDEVFGAALTDFELYRIVDDIHETKNLIDIAPQAAELRARMESEYRQLLQRSHVWSR